MKGGVRPGAGRKPAQNPTRPISIRMTDAQRGRYMALGGAKWLKALLDKL
jgi:hypothetical protein